MSNSDLSTEIGVAIASILSAKNDASGPTDIRIADASILSAKNDASGPTDIRIADASILSAKNDASGPTDIRIADASGATDSRSQLQNAYFARNNNTISASIKDITAINIKIFDNFDEAFKDATANAKVPDYYYVTIINKKDGTYGTTVEVPTDFIGTH
jgi:hypothetical protein